MRASFSGEESEAGLRRPRLDGREHRVVAGPAVLDPLGEDVVELDVEGVEERERRRRRGLLLLAERLDVDEVEVETAELLLFGPRERPLGDREDREARRAARGPSGSRVRATSRPHASVSTRVPASDVTTSAKTRASVFSRTTFAIAARSENVPVDVSLWTTVTAAYFFAASFFFTSSGEDRLAPLGLEDVGLEAEALAHFAPLVREGAVAAGEDRALDAGDEGGLPHARGGGGERVCAAVGPEDLRQLLQDAPVEVHESL